MHKLFSHFMDEIQEDRRIRVDIVVYIYRLAGT
jgi:hypothetical protein